MPPSQKGGAVLKPQATPGVFCWLPHVPHCPTYAADFQNPYPPLSLLLFLPILLPLEGKEG